MENQAAVLAVKRVAQGARFVPGGRSSRADVPASGISTNAGRDLSIDLRMVAAKNFQSGQFMLRQIEASLFEMRLHIEKDRQGSVQSGMDECRAEVAVA